MRKFLDLLNMKNWNANNNQDSEYPDVESIESQHSEDDNEELLINKNNLRPEPEPEPEPEPIITLAESVSSVNSENDFMDEKSLPYRSNRLLIRGLHLYFIDIAREIVQQKSINTIPLMRQYNISESDLIQIIDEMHKAQIISADHNILMSAEELERFIDIYEPSLFVCAHTIFDKDIFSCIGEIIFDDGIEKTYETMKADELIDYLNIMEALNIIKYNKADRKYDTLIDKNDFYKICKSIPEYFASKNCNIENAKYENSNIDTMSGVEFENYAAYILHKNGFINIRTTPASGDHGIDLTAYKDDISYAIQCKCYSSNIGNAAVQQAHTGKSIYHKDIAVVMTNRYFTQQAIDEAATLGVKLWDRDKLDDMIGKSK